MCVSGCVSGCVSVCVNLVLVVASALAVLRLLAETECVTTAFVCLPKIIQFG